MALFSSIVLGAGALLSAGSAIGGAAISADARKKAQTALNKAANLITTLRLPPDQARPLIIEELKRAGVYTPELEQAIQQEESKLAQLQEIDPSVRESQKTALNEILERGKVGLTPEERAALNKTRRKLMQDAESNRDRLLQSFAERGQLDSGAQLAAQLSAQQEATRAASDASEDISALASRRALEAISSGATIAGNMRGQDMDLAKTRASAEDEMNRFNVTNQIARNARNTTTLNNAQLANLQEAQRIQDTNTTMRNQEKLRQRAGEQTDYQNRFQKAQAAANALAGQASNMVNNADATAKMIGGIGEGIAGAGAAYANYAQKQDWLDHLKNKNNPDTSPQMANYLMNSNVYSPGNK